MTTKFGFRLLEEDLEVAHYLSKLPKGERSVFIRQALRHYYKFIISGIVSLPQAINQTRDIEKPVIAAVPSQKTETILVKPVDLTDIDSAVDNLIDNL